MNGFTKPIFGALIGAGIACFIALIFQETYYATFPGNHFLNVTKVEPEKDVRSDEKLEFTFCREPRTSIQATNNFRVFYLNDEGSQVARGEFQLPDGINYERTAQPCQILSISPDKRPSEPGVYRFCQQFDFEVKKVLLTYEKHADFCSSEFKQKAE